MHLVLRSSKAAGEWSFKKKQHALKIQQITSKFATKYGIKILSAANVGNHLHFQIKLTNRFTYRPFTRAVVGFKGFLKLRDYIRINKLEGHGCRRDKARFLLAWNAAKIRPANSS